MVCCNELWAESACSRDLLRSIILYYYYYYYYYYYHHYYYYISRISLTFEEAYSLSSPFFQNTKSKWKIWKIILWAKSLGGCCSSKVWQNHDIGIIIFILLLLLYKSNESPPENHWRPTLSGVINLAKNGVHRYLRWTLFMKRNVSFCRARAI